MKIVEDLVMDSIRYDSRESYREAVRTGLHDKELIKRAAFPQLYDKPPQSDSIKECNVKEKLSVLDKARELVYGDREKTCGSPDKNLKQIAAHWSLHLSTKLNFPIILTVDDVCIMMMQLKLARLSNSPKHEDSLVDICGYAALADRCSSL